MYGYPILGTQSGRLTIGPGMALDECGRELLQVGAVKISVDDFLVFENTLGDDTLFEGVKRLPPAHFLLVRDGAVTVRRYWAPPDRIDRGLDEADALSG